MRYLYDFLVFYTAVLSSSYTERPYWVPEMDSIAYTVFILAITYSCPSISYRLRTVTNIKVDQYIVTKVTHLMYCLLLEFST